jgi:orotidine-5'-phosphate decarboxylase
VIGRPVTAAPDPGRALEKINIEIQNALGDATGID